MPRSFDLSADYENSVEEIHRAFRAEGYWKARLADIPVDEALLESMRLGNDGTIEVTTVQVVRSHNLHALVKQLHRGDLCVRRTEVWGPLTDGGATAAVEGTIPGTPVDVSGTAELSPIAETGGARLTFRITVQVRVPLIGGKVERLIGTHLGDLVSREQRLTADWIAENP